MAHGKAWMVRAKRCWPMCFDCYEAYRKSLKREVFRRDSGLQESYIRPEKSIMLIRDIIDNYGRQQQWMAETSGLSLPTIKRLYVGHPALVMPSTERSVMALHERVVIAGKFDRGLKSNFRPARVAMLAVRGLMAQGWTQPWIAEQLGSGQRPISKIACGQQNYVTHRREEQLIELVRRVGSKQGDSTKTRRRAERNGWKPTMFYDELV